MGARRARRRAHRAPLGQVVREVRARARELLALDVVEGRAEALVLLGGEVEAIRGALGGRHLGPWRCSQNFTNVCGVAAEWLRLP